MHMHTRDFWRAWGRALAAAALAVVVLAAGVPAAGAGDAEIGGAVAAPCVACHGAGGAEPIANYPILAGQYEKYLLYTLRAYKSGKRPNAVMAQQLAGMSDRDLQNLAAYFAAQPSLLD